jgi:hypothetical protein
VIDWDLYRQLRLAAVAHLELGDAEVDLPSAVRVLDSWCSGDHAAVLFWVDRELDLSGFGHAVLHHVALQWADGLWHGRGGGGAGTLGVAEILGDVGPGLHRLGGSSSDPVRLTRAIGSPEVAMTELRSDRAVSARRPGVDGLCLLGITHSDPITYAAPLDADGVPMPGEPLLL